MGRCPAKSHVYRSRMNQLMVWWKAIAEWFDNSVDAGADQLLIDISDPNFVSIHDNGKGVSSELHLLTLGEHVEGIDTAIGTYGIGAKDAWASCADVMRLDTVCDGKRLEGEFDLQQIAANDFYYTDPTVSSSKSASYTHLEFELRPDRRPPGAKAFDRLAWAFAPAIASGIKIIVKSARGAKPLEAKQLPPLHDLVNTTFEVAGKSVTVNIGMTEDGASVENGPFWLVFGHRVICGTTIGAGEYSVRNVAGTITLGREWKDSLTPHKDNLAKHVEELEAAILERIEPLLKNAEAVSETLESRLLADSVSDLLTQTVNAANRVTGKEKRQSGTKLVEVDDPYVKLPEDSDKPKRKRKNATNVSGEGDVKKKPGGRIKIDWYFEKDHELIGRFNDGDNPRVSLNENHPLIQRAKPESDRTTIFILACSVLADHNVRHDRFGNSVFKVFYDDFNKALGAFLHDIPSPEGGTK